MTPERTTELAKQAGGAKYVNRHYPDRPSWGFMDDQFQRFAELVRADALEEAANVCDEMHEHYAGLKDTALLNRDVELSNAMSGEPRACDFLATAIRGLKK